tara:strand:- start:326 stop:646 length:321 start_codon:yes stop_codon:yes gene_type:complete
MLAASLWSAALASTNSSVALSSSNTTAADRRAPPRPTLTGTSSPRRAAPPRLLLPPRPLAPYDPPAVPDVAPHLIHPLRYAESSIVMMMMFVWYIVAMILSSIYSA